MTIRSSEIHYLQIVFSKETKKFSRIVMTLIFFQWKLIFHTFQKYKNRSSKRSSGRWILYWVEHVQHQFYLKFGSIFGFRATGAPFWAPFWYGEMCTWVFCFQSELKTEVLMDIQPCSFEKHEFFEFFELTPGVFAIVGAPFWAPKCQKCYSHKLQKKLRKIIIFIIFAQNASVLTTRPNTRNAIRFFTMASLLMKLLDENILKYQRFF